MKFGHKRPQYMWDVLAGSDLGYHPQGRPQALEGVGKYNPEALASRVFKL